MKNIFLLLLPVCVRLPINYSIVFLIITTENLHDLNEEADDVLVQVQCCEDVVVRGVLPLALAAHDHLRIIGDVSREDHRQHPRQQVVQYRHSEEEVENGSHRQGRQAGQQDVPRGG